MHDSNVRAQREIVVTRELGVSARDRSCARHRSVSGAWMTLICGVQTCLSRGCTRASSTRRRNSRAAAEIDGEAPRHRDRTKALMRARIAAVPAPQMRRGRERATESAGRSFGSHSQQERDDREDEREPRDRDREHDADERSVPSDVSNEPHDGSRTVHRTCPTDARRTSELGESTDELARDERSSRR